MIRNNVLKALYGHYVTEARFSEEGQGNTHSIAEKQLVELLHRILEEKDRNTAENLLVTTTADYEMQGFINGFRFATEIWREC